MIVIHASVPVFYEKRAEIEATARNLETLTRPEQGCCEYTFFWPIVYDGCLHLWECWEDQKALDLHDATEYSKAFKKALGAFATGDSEFVRYETL